MKKLKNYPMKKLFKILILLIPILGFSFNEETPFVKQKVINKAYFVKSDAVINIDNSYGNITISTWNEDKIELDILIKVSGDSEKWVNRRIDDIDVKIEALTNLVTAKTIIEDSDFYNNGNTNSFEINYVIKIPKNGSIKLNNKYGNIFSTDIFGNVDVECKYGKIVLGKLNGNNSKIELGYCPKSTIEFIKTGNIKARYSGITINESISLNLDSNYTDVVLDDCQNLVYDSNYGKLNLKKINNIKGSGNYMSLKIVDLMSNLDIETHYSKISIEKINEKANNILIDAGYTDLSIGYDVNFAFDFDLSTKYGNIKYDKDFEVKNSEVTNSSKSVDGFYKKKGANKLNIKSMYGNINLIKKL
jgi:hypothetical protein